jgi:hypothetical protein
MGKAGGKAAFKATEKRLAQLGYAFERINSKQWHVFSRKGSPDVALNPSVSERDARHLVTKLERQHGIQQQVNKRNSAAIKDRQRAERERIRHEMDRLDAERTALIRRKELLPTGQFDLMARNERLALERELQRIDRERREFVQMMTKLEAASA